MNKSTLLLIIIVETALFLSIVSASTAHADIHIVSTIASKHNGADGEWNNGIYQEFNEKNFGLGIEIGLDDNRNTAFLAGFYEDSYDSTAWYVGGMKRYWVTDNIALGGTLEMVTSPEYRKRTGRFIIPAAGFIATIQYADFGINLGLIPMGLIVRESEVKELWTLQITYKLFD